jgi:hypothetical protein
MGASSMHLFDAYAYAYAYANAYAYAPIRCRPLSREHIQYRALNPKPKTLACIGIGSREHI